MWTLVAPFWGRTSTMEALVWTLVALRAVEMSSIRTSEECPVIPRPRVDSGRALCGLSSRDSWLSRGLWSHTQIARKIVPQIASAIRVQIDAVDCLCSRSCSWRKCIS